MYPILSATESNRNRNVYKSYKYKYLYLQISKYTLETLRNSSNINSPQKNKQAARDF